MAAAPLTDIELLRRLLSVRPLGVFSDIDGTLAPIVPRPEDAKITPRSRELLKRLIGRGVRVALITGRPLETARKMTEIDGAAYAANHGLELWIDGRAETVESANDYAGLVQKVIAEVSGLEEAGVSIEVKGPGVAFHYRTAPDEQQAKNAIRHAVGESAAAKSFWVGEGRKVIELRPRLEINKGSAVQRLAQRLGVGSIVCMGDDVTDIDMFGAVDELRAEGLPGATVAVRNEETAEDILAIADYAVNGVGGVEWLLAEVLRVVGETEP